MRGLEGQPRERIITLAIGGLMMAHFAQLFAVVSRRYAYEDQTIMWDVAQDLRRGRFHQIDFPGQFYDSSLEAFPAALFGALGFADSTAFALGMLSITLVAWIALAWGVQRAEHIWLARAALLTPIVLTLEYSAIQLMWVTAVPRTLAVFAAAAALGVRRQSRRWLLAIAVGGVAVILDTSAALLVTPVFVWMAVRDRATLPWRAICLGTLAPATLFVGRVLHHRANPGYDLHPSPDLDIGLKPIKWHLENPSRTLGAYGPEVLGSPPLRTVAVVGLLALLAAFILRRGRFENRAAFAMLIVGLAFFYSAGASLRSAEFETALLSVGRGLMALPFVMIFLAIAAMDGRRWAGGPVVFALVGFLAFGGLVHRIAVDSSGIFVDDITTTVAIDVWSIDGINEVCDSLTAAVRQTNTAAAVSSSSTIAYACSARLSNSTVFFPMYERRTWELRQAWDTVQTRWVVSARVEATCGLIGDRVGCTQFGPSVLVAETPPWTLVDITEAVGQRMRPLPANWPDD